MTSTGRNLSPAAAFRLTVLALTFVLSTTLTSVAQSAQSGQGLTGTWRIQVTLQNCSTHVQLAPPFQSLLSFARGGTVIGTTSNPAFAAGQRTSDLGVWSYQGGQTYLADSEAFVLFNAGPFVKGTQRISQAIRVDGDQMTAVATVQFFNTNHVQVLAACAAAGGQRLQ